MTQQAYRKLVEDLCAAAGMSVPDASQKMFELQIKGIHFSLCHVDHAPDQAMIYCDFGPLPALSREAALLRLLQTNLYLFGVNSPTFTCNPETDHALLAAILPLASAGAEGTLGLLEGFAAMALEWRERFFLTSAELGGIPAVAARNLANSTAGRMARFARPA